MSGHCIRLMCHSKVYGVCGEKMNKIGSKKMYEIIIYLTATSKNIM